MFAALLVFSAVASGWVKVENDVAAYLPADSETRQGLDIMEQEFQTCGSAKILLRGTDADTAAATADLAQRADDLQAITDSLLASTDKLLAGLTDVAGSTSAAEADLNKGAEGSLPEQTVTVDQIKTSATPAPTEPPADSAVAGETTPEPTAAPTEAPQPDNSGTGETINVTMNGTAQTMDLVRCLAMVAQNELVPNAPADAYKAQCVATHCWR